MKTPRPADRPKRPAATTEGQQYFWTSPWQRAEGEASADIVNGRVKSFTSASELIEDLHRRRA